MMYQGFSGTSFVLANGSVKNVKDLEKNDAIIGSGDKVIVSSKSIYDGRGVVITPDIADPITIGIDNYLTLFHEESQQIVDVKITDYMAKPPKIKEHFKLIMMPINMPYKPTKNDPYIVGMLFYIKRRYKEKADLIKFTLKRYLEAKLDGISSYVAGSEKRCNMSDYDQVELTEISNSKTIPPLYLYNSRNVRFQFLNGFVEAYNSYTNWTRSNSKSPKPLSARSNSKSPRPSPKSSQRSSPRSPSNSDSRTRTSSAGPRKKGLEEFASLSKKHNSADFDNVEVKGPIKMTDDTRRQSRLSKFQSKIPKLSYSASFEITDNKFGEQMEFLVRSLGFKCVYCNNELTIHEVFNRLPNGDRKVYSHFSAKEIPNVSLHAPIIMSKASNQYVLLSNTVVVNLSLGK